MLGRSKWSAALMILPAAALMDIPAEHRAQSTSLATCCMWEGVRRGRDGGDGREKKNRRKGDGENRNVWWVVYCLAMEQKGGSPSLLTNRRMKSKTSFTRLCTYYLVASLSLSLCPIKPPPHPTLPPLFLPDHQWPLGKHFLDPGGFSFDRNH